MKWPLRCFVIAENFLLASETPSVLFQEPTSYFRCYLLVEMKFETFFALLLDYSSYGSLAFLFSAPCSSHQNVHV